MQKTKKRNAQFYLKNERNEKNGKNTAKLSVLKAFCACVFYLQSKKTEILLLHKRLRGMRNSQVHAILTKRKGDEENETRDHNHADSPRRDREGRGGDIRAVQGSAGKVLGL